MYNLSPDVLPINRRFFEALDVLKSRRELGGIHGFASKYGVATSNLYTIKTKEQGAIKVEFLMYLVRDFNLSAQWLLTGEGNMFKGRDGCTEVSNTATQSKKAPGAISTPEAFVCPFLSRKDNFSRSEKSLSHYPDSLTSHSDESSPEPDDL